MEFQKLYDVASNGSIKEWQISTEGPDIITTHGKQGMKAITTVKTIKEGKNIGKANETTPAEQALSEAKSTYQKKLDKGYVTDPAHAETKAPELLPMLAHPYTKRGHDIVFPAYIQPKFNGARMFAHKLSETEIRYTSRMGKEFTTVSHLTETLLAMMDVGQIFDGEIYNHDWSFQRIISAVKKQSEDSALLEFWVYDTIHPNNPQAAYEARLADLDCFVGASGSVKMAPTKSILAAQYVQREHNQYVAEGYEGLIIRNASGIYSFKHRSKDLQKFKMFVDAEFKITGGKEGTGNDEGCIVFEVETASGSRFNVRPKGTVAYRRSLFQDLPNLLGKLLTVRYQELSEAGVPIFGVGLAVRDYE